MATADRGRRLHGDDRRARERLAESGDEADHAEDRETRRAEHEAAHREDTEQRAQGERDHRHDDLQGELVVGPEEADDDVLGAGRLQVDDDLADGIDQRRRSRQDAGDRLGHAEAEGRCGYAGERGQPPSTP